MFLKIETPIVKYIAINAKTAIIDIKFAKYIL